MSTLFYSHPACRLHVMGRGHPECPERLDAITDHLKATGLDLALDWRAAPVANAEQLAHAHDAAYVASISELLQRAERDGTPVAVDPDTSANAGTWLAALHAAGAAVAATDEVIAGRADNAFCAVRPPGHHATRSQAMGFCFFNNVVVAARHALDVHGLQRVAVIDFDVHHGNGTEDIVAGDPRILMCSFFQHPLYPYSGMEPTLDAFKPQMLFISAGFDAHRDDDLGQMGLVEADYAWLTELLRGVAERHCGGRIVSCLEGGYALDALARSVAAHLRVLAQLD
jgi:acetoin utilization deacetylase AcuC-like enzyme